MTTKVAIVTGGAQGIGKAITGVLLKDGYKVGILDYNESAGKQTVDELASLFGSGSCVFFKCDVTEKEKLKDCYGQVRDLMGRISVVVNNAGILDEFNSKKMININLGALIDSTYLAMETMRKDKGGNGGTIVNVASLAGIMPWIGFPTYTATKWAVVGFTKSMAASLALAEEDWGISLLTLCPSFVDTPLLTAVAPGGVEPMTVAPSVPKDPCKDHLKQTMQNEGLISLDDLASAFEKLLKDNKNGSVLLVTKHGDSFKATYVQHKWTEE